MINQPSVRLKAWNTPFWITFVVLLFLGLKVYSWTTVEYIVKTDLGWFLLILWPCVVVAEMVLYRIMRKRLTERHLIWGHLICSLFGYVILNFLMVLLSYLSAAFNVLGPNPTVVYTYINIICFWGSILTGHLFFIVAMVRIYAARNSRLPGDDNDLLSEFTV